MQFFTVATLKGPVGPQAAIGVENKFYLISDLQREFHSSLKDLLLDWPASFSMLEQLAASIVGGAFKNRPAVSEDEADLATPVIYPNKLMAVGANYSGHLQEMGPSLSAIGALASLPLHTIGALAALPLSAIGALASLRLKPRRLSGGQRRRTLKRHLRGGCAR